MGDMDRCLTRSTDGGSFVTRRIATETVIVPVSGKVGNLESVYTLNEVGSFVWELIDGRRTAQAIVEEVCARYEVLPGQAARDVDELLESLEARGLVRVAGESQGRA
jgi:hypothetical protein